MKLRNIVVVLLHITLGNIYGKNLFAFCFLAHSTLYSHISVVEKTMIKFPKILTKIYIPIYELSYTPYIYRTKFLKNLLYIYFILGGCLGGMILYLNAHDWRPGIIFRSNDFFIL